MKKLIVLFLILVVFGCNNVSNNNTIENNEDVETSQLTENNIQEEDDWNIKKELIKKTQYHSENLKLEPISNLNSETLRIWRFPGGGVVFEQLFEFNNSKRELIAHTFLIELVEKEDLTDLKFDKKEFSNIENSEKIKDNEIIKKLNKITSDPNFLHIEDYDKFCESILIDGNVFLVEFTNGNKTNTFTLDDSIESCDNEKAESSKSLYKIISQFIVDYSF